MTHPNRDRLCEHLQRVPYFAGLDAGELCQLAGLATWHEYAPGAIVFLKGDVTTGLYAVDAGWVKVVKFSLDGREQVLRYFGPGEVFSEIGIFLARPNPANAIALERAALWRLHRSANSGLSSRSTRQNKSRLLPKCTGGSLHGEAGLRALRDSVALFANKSCPVLEYCSYYACTISVGAARQRC